MPSLTSLESAFTVESTLSPPCSCSNPLFVAKVQLSTLTIWCFGQMALFFFLMAKAALEYLPTAFSVVFFPFQQAQYAQVFLIKLAPFCKLFAGPGSTNKSVTSLLYDSRHPVFIFSFTSISSRSSRNCLLSPVLSCYNGSMDTRFSRGTTWLMSWPDGEL